MFAGLTFTFLLWTVRSRHRAANRYLSVAVGIMALWLLRILLINIGPEQYLRSWDLEPMQLLLALGPCLYFYVRQLTHPQYRFSRRDLLHFVPAVLQLAGLLLAAYAHSVRLPVHAATLFDKLNPAWQLLVFVSMITYLYRCDQLIRNHYRGLQPVLMDRSLLEFRWLRRLVAATALLWVLWLFHAIWDLMSEGNGSAIHPHHTFYIFFTVMLFWTAAAAFLQPHQEAIAPKTLQPQRPVAAETREKANWLTAQMETHRHHRDPELTLGRLAEHLNLTPHELSRLVNSAFKKSFTDFVNAYRVADAARKMQDPAYDNITLLGIGFEAGFNSKTSFNRTFREMTGKNPTEYKNGLKNERPSYNMGHLSPSRLLILRREPLTEWAPVKSNSHFMIRNYFKTAFRNLVKNKVYSAINIAGLSIGLACAILIVLYVQDELSYDRFHRQASRIYRIDRKNTKDDGRVSIGSYTGYFPGPRFSAKIPGINTFVRFQSTKADIKKAGQVQSQDVCLADTNFFSVFSFPLLSGDAASALREPNSVVITEAVAEQYFGRSDAVGRILSIKEDSVFKPYVVTAVAKNCPQNSSIKFQVILPLKVSAIDESNNGNWFNSFLSTFVVLSPGADIASVQNKMAQVFESDASRAISEIKNKYGVQRIGIDYLLEPLTTIHLGKLVQPENEALQDKSNPEFSFILSAIAVFILLIACINFVNLTVARSVKRAKEIGIRKVIGGTTRQLRAQFLSESFVLCLFAFMAALVIVLLLLPLFGQLSNKALSISYLITPKMVLSYVALFVATAFFAGFYPSIVLSNYNPVEALYSRFSLAGKNYLQKGLVVFQFALASFLIIGSITIYLQFNFLTSQSLGYDDAHLITVRKAGLRKEEAILFKQALLKNPGIVDAAARNSGDDNNTVKVNISQQINTSIETIDETYLPLLKVPIAEGRNFSRAYPADAGSSVLVNETFVKEAGWNQAVGQQVAGFEKGEVYTIVGVVKDFHNKPLTEKITPQLFTMNPASRYGMMYIRIKPGTETASLQYIAKTFNGLFPMHPFLYAFKQEQNERSYAAESRWKQILFVSALLTIFISCIGLFGLSVLAAEKRVKEIGVRKVLGASVTQIVGMLSADFLRLIGFALVVAMPLSFVAAHRWLRHYPYRITLSWTLFASGALLVVLIAFFTISFQSVKAAIANPVKSLRTE